MKIIDIITADKPSLSFEVFPPKTDASYASVEAAALAIADLKPSYMSVTYGAGGGTSKYTLAIAKAIAARGVTPIAHLTCINSPKDVVEARLTDLREAGIENVLALRGDLAPGADLTKASFAHASDLTAAIRAAGDFCIGGACYPETHPESATAREDIAHLKEKVEAGCEFLTTQMFFDNDILYNFLYRIREAGITVPVVAGIMPLTHASQLKRIVGISGNQVPQRFRRIVDQYGDDPAAMKQAGIAYAVSQIVDLYANGINAVHVYSMNHPDVAAAIQTSLSAILGRP